MKGRLPMSIQRTCADTPSAIFSPGSGSGLTHFGLQDGPMTAPSGPDHAHASLFQAPVPGRGPTTPATCGPSGSTSSASADLQRFLESRLKQRLSTDGLILYRATWKTRVTPAGRSVCLLALSVPRTSDNDCGSWPTPNASNPNSKATPPSLPRSESSPPMTLADAAVHLSGWATPLCNDARGSAYSKSRSGTILKLTGMARLVTSGQMLTGCTAETKNGGQLNPAHSRWLMGLPLSWDQAAPGKVKAVREC